ncbi:SDR family NAD(P)-dependent oxidoreductase, partial [Micromonospora sp. KC207]|uniref:SDR family NAD(P)-dependent oxidoreductase n=1 Tax=Micromonospora sp. KC207 TaxID=2530377 RepID=UPI001044CA4E
AVPAAPAEVAPVAAGTAATGNAPSPGAVVRVYTRRWEPAAPAPVGPPPAALLLVTGDAATATAALSASIAPVPAAVSSSGVSAPVVPTAPEVVTVDPDRPAALDRVATAAAALPAGGGVFVLWHPGWSAAVGLRLLRALRGSPVRRMVAVHARPYGADPDPAAETLGALAGPAGLDGVAFTAVEVVDDANPAGCLRAGLAEWHATGGEVRHETGRRWEPRLVPADPDGASSPAGVPALRAGGTWLVTGGLGALGRAVAGHLAARHGARIVLTGRSPLPAHGERVLDELRGTGAGSVEYHPVDVTDVAGLTALVRDVRTRYGGLTGVVHAAGVMDPRPWPEKDDAAVDAVLRPKVDGVRALDEATRGEDLDAFVLFSSAAAVLGDIGLGDYGVANRYLDGYAQAREAHRARGERRGRTVCVNWPLWRDGGMHLPGEAMYLASAELSYLDTPAALAAFDRILSGGWPQALVLAGAPAALDRLTGAAASSSAPASERTAAPDGVPTAGNGAAVLNGAAARNGTSVPNGLAPVNGLAPATGSVPANGTVASNGVVAVSTAADGHDDAVVRDRLAEKLRAIAAEVLCVDAERMDLNENLGAFGFDSITLRDLAGRLSEVFGVTVTPTLFYARSSLAEVAGYLVEEKGDTIRARYAVPAPPVPAPADPAPVAAVAPATRVVDQSPVGPVARVAAVPGGGPDSAGPGGIGGAEPIAIVGMAGVFPGVADPDEFWQRLVAGEDLVTEVPADRWNWREFYSEERFAPGRTQSRWGGFVDGHDRFDADFFGISPREAELMDPQHRLFLQAAWAAVEDAGWVATELSGRRIGVFAGVQFAEYQQLLTEAGISQVQVGTGNAHTMLPNRVSYQLNLRGPSEAVDTACSSSLMAVHRAMRALRAGECEAALAGGVSLILTPYYYVLSNQAGVLSPTGRCRTFDAAADGYVRGEGAGVVVLKPLRRALADGDHVYAVIRGGAANHGGRASSPTAPNSAAQAELVAAALADAGVDPATVSYVETHGTGTELGDPVEVEGLTEGFAAARAAGSTLRPGGCGLGSVKTQIGHLEPAAGVASLVKVVLALRHRTLPGVLHLNTLNPYLTLDGGPFHVVGETRPWLPWPDSDGRPLPLRAGVSSFGFGGSNVHLVVEEAPPLPAPPSGGPQLLVLSARNPQRLRAYAGRLATVLGRAGDGGYGGGPADLTLADVAYTLQIGREPMAERMAMVVGDLAETADLLARFATDGHAEGVLTGKAGAAGEAARSLVDGPAGRDYLRALCESAELAQLGRLWVAGVAVDWRLLHRAASPRRVPLPTYPFAPSRYWFTPVLPGTPPTPASADVADTTTRPAVPEAAGPGLPDLYVPRWVPAGPAPATPPARAGWILTTPAGRPLAAALASRYPHATVGDLDTASVPEDDAEICVVAVDPPGAVLPETDRDDAALGLVRLVRALGAAGRTDAALTLRVVTAGVYPLDGATAPTPYGATCHGLARAAAREHPSWRVHVLDVAAADLADPGAAAQAVIAVDLPVGEEVLLRGVRRLVRELRPALLPPAARSPYRERGVYLIVGGAGGIGAELADHLARTARARLALVGRSVPGEAHQRLCDRIAAAGGEAVYLSADVSDPAALGAAVAQVRRRFGALHGVVHSALVLRDGTLRSMSDEGLRAVFAPKVAGMVALADALAGESLDFLLLLSSAQSFVGAAGQGNYAAASAYEDAFAGLLRHHGRWPVRVVNWGYWGSVGAVATPEYARRLAAQGARSIEPAEGMEVVTRLLAGPVDQVLAVRTDPSRLAQVLRVGPSAGPDDAAATPAAVVGVPAEPALPPPARLLADPPRLAVDTVRRAGVAWDALDALARRWLLETLRGAGVLTAAGQRSSLDELRRILGVSADHDRLLTALVNVLVRAGWLTRDGERLLVTAAADVPAVPVADEARRLAAEHPAMRPHLRLLDACLSRYPQVLAGRVPATEVLFPGGSGELLDGIYAGDEVTGHFNDLVGYAVAEFVRRRTSAGAAPVRVVEIGAGSGATSEVLFRVLRPYADRLRYVFTDVSHQFVWRAAERFGPQFPAAKFRVLDIERDVAGQDFLPGEANLVLATNVLHATSDVAVALAQAKRLLAPGGWLVINEGTRVHDYATLTFGLLDGWWRYTDAMLRIPDAPMLDRDAWLVALAGAGFRDTVVLGLGADCPPSLTAQQSVLVAVSDGMCVPGRSPAGKVSGAAPSVTPVRSGSPSVAAVASVSGTSVASDASVVPAASDRSSAPVPSGDAVGAAVLATIAQALRIDPADLDPDGPHADRGVDSVLAIEIANTINATLGVRIRSTDLFN